MLGGVHVGCKIEARIWTHELATHEQNTSTKHQRMLGWWHERKLIRNILYFVLKRILDAYDIGGSHASKTM